MNGIAIPTADQWSAFKIETETEFWIAGHPCVSFSSFFLCPLLTTIIVSNHWIIDFASIHSQLASRKSQYRARKHYRLGRMHLNSDSECDYIEASCRRTTMSYKGKHILNTHNSYAI